MSKLKLREVTCPTSQGWEVAEKIQIYQFKCYLVSEARPLRLNKASFQDLFISSVITVLFVYLIVHFLLPSRMYTSQRQASFCLVFSYAPMGISLCYNRHSEMSDEWMNERTRLESLTALTTALTLKLAFYVNSQDDFLCWNLILPHLKRISPKHHKHTFRNTVLAWFRTCKTISFF